MTTEEGAKWLCLYCGQPIAEPERRAAPKVILGGMRVGRAHPACKAQAITKPGIGIWGTGIAKSPRGVR
jgi:hypothetical protein